MVCYIPRLEVGESTVVWIPCSKAIRHCTAKLSITTPFAMTEEKNLTIRGFSICDDAQRVDSCLLELCAQLRLKMMPCSQSHCQCIIWMFLSSSGVASFWRWLLHCSVHSFSLASFCISAICSASCAYGTGNLVTTPSVAPCFVLASVQESWDPCLFWKPICQEGAGGSLP